MSLWQLQACIEGYLEANRTEDDKSLSSDEIAEIGDWVEKR